MYAIADNRPDLALLLIDCGTDVNAGDKKAYTALHFAAQTGEVGIAASLIEHGAKIDVQDAWGNTPLGVAVSNSRCNGEMIRLLLAHGADKNIKNNYGISPLDYARQVANYNIVQFFEESAGES